jgi:hypothetical protein
LPEDVTRLASLVKKRNLSEDVKTEDRARIAGRIALFHDAIALGLRMLDQKDSE